MNVKRLKGFRDILPEETPAWARVEEAVARIFGSYGYSEIRVPLLEQAQLFQRSIGETTDIVEKEMYTFEDVGGDMISLRPEGTASVVRAYIENGMARSNPKKRLYYLGPMFRRERPQKGRFRQFHQVGAECFGWLEPEADADVMAMLSDLFDDLGLSGRVSMEINSLGCGEDRRDYVEKLKSFARPFAEKLCGNCQGRIDRNPLRLLDCKRPECKELMADAPDIAASLCGDCSDHFARVRAHLDNMGVAHERNPRMVRGLDYYNRTTFELVTTELGAQNAVAAGGRYDGLVSELGGAEQPGIGFAIGVERLVLMLGEDAPGRDEPLVWFVHRGDRALDEAMKVRKKLISAGIGSDLDFEPRSFKAQMRGADKSGARFVFIFGEEEVASGRVAVKDLADGNQETVDVDEAIQRMISFREE